MNFKLFFRKVCIFLSFVFFILAVVSGIFSVLCVYMRSLFAPFFQWLNQNGISDWVVNALPIVALGLFIGFYLLDQILSRHYRE